MKARLSTIVVTAALLGLLLGACAPAATPTPVPGAPPAKATEVPPTPMPVEKVLKVGSLQALTGVRLRIEDERKKAIQMALDEVDNKVGDYRIEMVWMDHENNPEVASRVFTQGITRDGVQAVLWSSPSTIAVACMEVAAQYKIPCFFSGAGTEVTNEKYRADPEKYSYWGKMWPSPISLAPLYAAAFEDAINRGLWTPKNKVIALAAMDQDWGRSYVAAMADEMSRTGWEIASEDFFGLGEQDFYPLLSKYVELGVDLIFVVGESPVAEALIKQARQVELEALIIMDGLSYIADWYKTTGEAGDYVVELGSPPWTEGSSAVAQKMKDLHGIDASPVSTGMLYDVTKCFLKLAERTLGKYGDLNSETIYKTSMEELYTGKLVCEGVMGMTWKWLPETLPDLVVGEGYFTFPLVQYFDGKPVNVWPEAVREADLRIPPWMQ